MATQEMQVTVYEDSEMLISRVQREDGKAAILKQLSRNAKLEVRKRLRHEYKLLAGIDLPGVVKPFGLEERMDGCLILSLEDIGGDSLDRLLEPNEHLGVVPFLKLAIGLAETLMGLHRLQIVHKAINPAHIVMNTAGEFRLVGFGVADTLPQSQVALQPPAAIAGDLAYIAPEQSGRMNRSVDYRADFYSLGATFYRLLTGRPPFQAEDALGLVHQHVAVIPIPPHEIDDAIPPALSAIVMKLLAKMAEDRYQSGCGLKSDLERCQHDVAAGILPDFMPGQKDFPDRLRVPEKLYGREREVATLLAAFNRMAQTGKPEFVLVSGYSGVGKSSVVNELQKTLVSSHGLYASGKFDQSRLNVPYATLVQAFEKLTHLLLGESEAVLDGWRHALRQALEPNARLISELIGGMRLILGDQPSVPELEPKQAKARFQMVFRHFVCVFARREHPLVLFLDDLQWVDAATLDFVEGILAERDACHLLLIGAYRDNEVGPGHPLVEKLDSIRKTGTDVREIKLSPLALADLMQMIDDTLHCGNGRAEPLARLIHAKTSGNPFFAIQFLNALFDEKLLAFDTASVKWIWELERIQAKRYTENVADLMVAKLARLPDDTRQALKRFACLGNMADAKRLATILQLTEESTHAVLRDAVQSGLVLLQGDDYIFLHDRIQEAAYSLIPEGDRKRVHLDIGRLLLQSVDNPEQQFDIVDHLDLGAELISREAERIALANLNLQAGRRARTSAAFAAAARYFEKGIALLSESTWLAHYDLTLALNEEAAESATLVGNFKRTEQLFHLVVDHARHPVDMTTVYISRMMFFSSQGRLPELFDCALEILDRLDAHIDPNPTKEAIATALTQLRAAYGLNPMDTLDSIPTVGDQRGRAIMRVLDLAQNNAYSGRPDLFAMFVIEAARRTIDFGRTPESVHALLHLALLLCGLPDGDIDDGYQYAMLAMALARQAPDSSHSPPTLGTAAGMIWPFKRHLRETPEMLKPLYPRLKEIGDFEYAGYVACWLTSNCLLFGMELVELEQLMVDYREDMRRIRAEVGLRWLSPFLQAVQNLQGKSDCPWVVDGEAYPHNAMLRVIVDTGNLAAQTALHVNTLVLCYLFGQYEEAHAASVQAETARAGMVAMPIEPVWYFYDSLTELARCAQATASERGASLQRVADSQTYLSLRADHAPMNYRHKWHLVEAERYRILGDGMAAIEQYDKAIALAGDNGFIHEEALANELAGKFWLERGKEDFARLHIERATRGYARWQAFAKVKAMQREFPQWLAPGALLGASSSIGTLDFNTLIKATRAISGMMEMNELLTEVLNLAVENAGAESGFLIVESGGQWQVVASVSKNPTAQQATPPLAIDTGDLVSPAVVRYVVRMRETLLLDDALSQGEFTNDPHIRATGTRSLLCMPLTNRGHLIGILYLKNDLACNVFTAERLEFLEVLASQAAISMENAELYAVVRRSERKFRAILDNTFQFIGLLSVDGTVLQTNLTALQFAGVSENDVLGIPFWETPWWRHSTVEQRRLRDAVSEAAAGRFVRFETTHLAADNREYIVDFSLKPVTGVDGKVELLVAEGRDITERKEAEEALRRYKDQLEETVRQRTAELQKARDAAETANKAKSMFLANMSHELRTPLNAILGFAQIMERDPEMPPHEQRNLETINRSGHHLLSLINDVLEISRIEAGRVTIENQAFELSQAILAVEEMIQVRAESKGLAFSVERKGDLPSWVMGDATHLSQVLVNLLGNAVKFTDQGRISLCVEAEQEQHIRFTVSDTGPGIGAEDQARVFQAFYQTKAGTAKGEGTGLGLTISREFVQLMGGDLNLSSMPGSGSVFSFSIPLPTSEPPIEAPRAGRVVGIEPGQKPPRILVVEDNADNRAFVLRLLEEVGLEVRAAENGKQAIETFRAWRPQFIWMDMRMPGMNGYEATQRIRALEGGKEVRIVALTASAFQEDRAAVLAAGCDDIVSKPIKEDRLFAVMEQQLDLRLHREASVTTTSMAAATDISLLPEEIRRQLCVAATALDQKAALACVARIRSTHPTEAAAIVALVEEFRYDILLKHCS